MTPAASAHPLSASEPILLRENEGNVAVLTLNRPAARNALSEALLTELADALSTIAADRDVRVAVLAASGSAFCAGHDLKELTARRSDADRGRAYFKQIVGLPQLVIAAVHGTATAAGCQLVASCDLAVASSAAKFATPGVNIGLFCSTPMVALSRNVARKHAMELLLTGEMVSAADAYRMGLVNRVTPEGEAMHEARRLALLIASKSPLTLKIGKRAFYEQLEMGLADAYRHASAVMVENMLARDAEEGIGAFIDKREAKWEGR